MNNDMTPDAKNIICMQAKSSYPNAFFKSKDPSVHIYAPYIAMIGKFDIKIKYVKPTIRASKGRRIIEYQRDFLSNFII